ncbi:Transposase DDE domain protein [Botrimarina colliarenosi]|uniref:Transposase DDE domain protein n=1 Tax=Botrimarina colliarenosi TaxID=2528001 RepID=A0A5C6A9T3_9BACT|nr:Transposase DDE domain protein [Botrimarina colliarenosi]
MRSATDGRCRSQISFLRRQFLQDDGLPFGDVLGAQTLSTALAAIEGGWVDRIYTPMVTLWVFLGQVLSADHSCRAAVARLIAHRVAGGESRCSAETGAYCQARKRLPEAFFAEAVRETGRSLDAHVKKEWLWKGRRVRMFDGSTVTMPDTAANQAEYPQTSQSKPGAGFPIARLGVISSLCTGAVLNLGFCPYAGKGTGEVTLLQRLWGVLVEGDVLLTDCKLGTWKEILTLKRRGIDFVSRMNRAHRSADFRLGQRLGKEDHIVQWSKPSSIRTIDWPTYHALPDWLTVREARVRITTPGFRTKEIIVVTTLLDPKQYPKEDLAELYRARWNQELDLRSIKTTMQMDALRCKTPELVRKEAWAHLLAYNLIRTVMAQAAAKHGGCLGRSASREQCKRSKPSNP